MKQAQVALDPAFTVGEIDPRIRGSFVEHLGRCVYGGIWEPDHPEADADGFRADVLELTRELGVTTVRYPGGNFVSGYRWEDGVGPVADRPRRLDPAWNSVESNRVGTDEFIAWCRKAGVEPMLAVNLGTRGAEAAADLVEYCNHPSGTRLSDSRIAAGAAQPHGVKLWCLGNEMDGPWQMGQKNARDYGILAGQTGRMMRMIDPSLELVACGSSNRGMPTFASWEAEVLEHAYDAVDYVSLHSYYQPRDSDIDSFLACGADMDAMITEVIAACDYVKAKLRKRKTINLSYDEWNVWYTDVNRPPEVEDWAEAPPLLQNIYSALDAVVVGSMLNSLLRHADRVKLACFAQLVNVIAPIATRNGGPAWRQSTFHPMALTFQHARGSTLRVAATGPMVQTERYGEVTQLDAVGTLDAESGRVALFFVNRSQYDPLRVEVDLRAFGDARPVEHLSVNGDPAAVNTEGDPERVVPRRADVPTLVDKRVALELPPASWHLVRVDTSGR